MTRPRPAALLAIPLLAAAALAACAPAGPGSQTAATPHLTGSAQEAPPGAPAGTCWSRVISPAVIETVTEQVLIAPEQPAAEGADAIPASYRTETRQQIVTERRTTWFETPCPEDITPDLIASLQRALSARGLYSGPVTGQIDARTSAAILRYQAQSGLDSAVLSLDTARQLGLVAIPRDQVNAD